MGRISVFMFMLKYFYLNCVLEPLILKELFVCFSPLKGVKWAKHVACLWEIDNAYRILIGKPEGMSSF
jgi:hypothetical protein